MDGRLYFNGHELCEPCWNGNHYGREVGSKKKFSNCLGGFCECKCRELLNEKRPRIKRYHKDQITISEVAGTIDIKKEAL